MMNKALRVAKKEFLDMFRDRRSLARMMLIPLIAFPIIMYLVTQVQSSQNKKTAEKELTVGYVLNGQSDQVIKRIEKAEHISIKVYTDSVKMRTDVKNDEITVGLIFNKNFDQSYSDNKTSKINMIRRGADQEENDRIEKLLDQINGDMINERLLSQDLDTSLIKAFDYSLPQINRKKDKKKVMMKKKELIEWYDVSEFREKIGKYAGGILPYIFLAFCFMGCMYPAIDLFAGEKERGTMETLLVTPVNRLSILAGKMIVIASFGLLSATLALVGLFVSMNLMDFQGDGAVLVEAINQILSPQLVVTLYLLLIPVTIFFTGVMVPISIYAKSYKEAQSIMVPLNIVMVLPAMAGFFPSVELDYVTAFIPIVNVVLATKHIIAGNADILLLAITFISLILLAAVSLFVSRQQFGKESNILRGE